MALLFAFGVMNLLWVAGLSLLVLLEKIAPFERLVTAGLPVSFLSDGQHGLFSGRRHNDVGDLRKLSQPSAMGP